jgi:hypothetical protein
MFVVDRETEVGPLWFLPLLAIDSSPAVQSVCGARNHSFLYVQCTTLLFVSCRKSFACTQRVLSGLFPPAVVLVKFELYGALFSIHLLGLVGGVKAATNSCLCACFSLPPPLFRSGFWSISRVEAGHSPSPVCSLILSHVGRDMWCVCASTAFSCKHYTINHAGWMSIDGLARVKAGFSPSLLGVIVGVPTAFASYKRSPPSTQKRAGLDVGVLCERPALVLNGSP